MVQKNVFELLKDEEKLPRNGDFRKTDEDRLVCFRGFSYYNSLCVQLWHILVLHGTMGALAKTLRPDTFQQKEAGQEVISPGETR